MYLEELRGWIEMPVMKWIFAGSFYLLSICRLYWGSRASAVWLARARAGRLSWSPQFCLKFCSVLERSQHLRMQHGASQDVDYNTSHSKAPGDSTTNRSLGWKPKKIFKNVVFTFQISVHPYDSRSMAAHQMRRLNRGLRSWKEKTQHTVWTLGMRTLEMVGSAVAGNTAGCQWHRDPCNGGMCGSWEFVPGSLSNWKSGKYQKNTVGSFIGVY